MPHPIKCPCYIKRNHQGVKAVVQDVLPVTGEEEKVDRTDLKQNCWFERRLLSPRYGRLNLPQPSRIPCAQTKERLAGSFLASSWHSFCVLALLVPVHTEAQLFSLRQAVKTCKSGPDSSIAQCFRIFELILSGPVAFLTSTPSWQALHLLSRHLCSSYHLGCLLLQAWRRLSWVLIGYHSCKVFRK